LCLLRPRERLRRKRRQQPKHAALPRKYSCGGQEKVHPKV